MVARGANLRSLALKKCRGVTESLGRLLGGEPVSNDPSCAHSVALAAWQAAWRWAPPEASPKLALTQLSLVNANPNP